MTGGINASSGEPRPATCLQTTDRSHNTRLRSCDNFLSTCLERIGNGSQCTEVLVDRGRGSACDHDYCEDGVEAGGGEVPAETQGAPGAPLCRAAQNREAAAGAEGAGSEIPDGAPRGHDR